MSGPRLRAPAGDGEVLAVPPWARAAGLSRANAEALGRTAVEIGGLPLGELRRRAVADALAAAGDYHRALGLPVPPSACRLIVTGHQPELFHPGVWVKNFAAARLAADNSAAGLNLVVDSDLVKASSIWVPQRHAGSARAVRVAYDAARPGRPYEESAVADEATFAAFPQAVEVALGAAPFRPILPDFWAAAVRAGQRTCLLGDRITAARRVWEEGWGCHNFELPVSRLAGTEAFAHVVQDLLTRADKFCTVYNDQLLAYRIRHRLKSTSHPVAALERDGDWCEVPLWVWRAGAERRGRLFARPAPGGVELRSDEEAVGVLPAGRPPGGAFQDLAAAGWKVRPRALITTAFARLVLADLFIHGLGGGIYDELTDQIIREFYRLEPPGFLILTATLRLPYDLGTWSGPSPQEVHRRLRHVTYHPEAHLPPAPAGRPAVAALVRDKADWVARQPSQPDEKRQRWREIRRLNEELAPFVTEEAAALEEESAAARRREEGRAVLSSREYAACLHPADRLHELFVDRWAQ